MPTYTAVLEKPLETISWEDDNFLEELLEVVQLFRPFSEAFTEFLVKHGYRGEPSDTEARVAFIREAFAKAGMEAPREVREWFTRQQPIRRETAIQICYAFGLDGSETDEFFSRYYIRERSLDCHRVREAIDYFCLNHGLSYAEAGEIEKAVPEAPEESGAGGEDVYTGTIMAELNRLETKEQLIAYLTGNIDRFSTWGVTAREAVRRLWERTAGPDGLLIQERRHEKLLSILDDEAAGKKSPLPSGADGVRAYDAYLGILQLKKKSVNRLSTDRSIRPILEGLHGQVRDSFPDRQGIEKIIRGEKISYERMRKWLVLLAFYTYGAQEAVSRGSYEAGPEDNHRCIAMINNHLVRAGYPELYVGNPYDWIFLYASECREPLFVFRLIWHGLLTDALEAHR